MFQSVLRPAIRPVRIGHAAIAALSLAVHLAVVLVLIQLPEPVREHQLAEELTLLEFAALEGMEAPMARSEPDVRITAEPGEATVSAEIEEVPAEIPPVAVRLALPEGMETQLEGEDEAAGELGSDGVGTTAMLLDSVAVTPAPTFQFTYDSSEPVRPPRLRNRQTMVDLLLNRYPTRLLVRRIPGSVTLSFTIDERGIVDPTTVRVLDTDQDEFAVVVLAIASRFRFWPARYRDQNVPIAIHMPVKWTPGD